MLESTETAIVPKGMLPPDEVTIELLPVPVEFEKERGTTVPPVVDRKQLKGTPLPLKVTEKVPFESVVALPVAGGVVSVAHWTTVPARLVKRCGPVLLVSSRSQVRDGLVTNSESAPPSVPLTVIGGAVVPPAPLGKATSLLPHAVTKNEAAIIAA